MFLNISCGIVWTVPTGPRVGSNMLQATGKASKGISQLSSSLESSIQEVQFFIYLNQINSGDFALVPQKFWHRDTFCTQGLLNDAVHRRFLHTEAFTQKKNLQTR